MTLREWSMATDNDPLIEWMREDHTLHEALGLPKAPTPAEIDKVTVAMLMGMAQGLLWVGAFEENDQPIGLGLLYPIEGEDATVHFLLSPAHRGKGKEAAELGIQRAKDLGLTRLHAEVRNDHIQHLAEELGFRPTLWTLDLES